jgi:formyltetrahydrofolate deformylase
LSEQSFSTYGWGMEKHLILTITCPDRKGIIAAVTKIIAKEGGNILNLNQHTATDIQTFMLKAEFGVSESYDPEQFRQAFQELASNFDMKWQLDKADKRKKVAILVSKTNHTLYELLLKHQDGELNCDFQVIISNHENNRPVAQQFGIPYHFVDVKGLGKAKAEEEIQSLLKNHEVDLVVMARYMQILSPEFTKNWEEKIINIHHGFLPAFQGARPYHQAWYKGVKIIGATAHFATEDLDQGPIIAQEVIQVSDSCSISEFIQLGKDVERRTLFHGVKKYLDHSVFVYGNRTFILD